jgi:hypothetical protein
MVKKKHGVMIETAMEARQTEPRPVDSIAAYHQRKYRGDRYGLCLVPVFPY